MRILVGVDKSEESQMALRYVCKLLEHFSAEVNALYVKPSVAEMVADGSYAPFVGKAALEKAIETDARTVEEDIVEACQICLAGKVDCNPRVVMGDPADEILHAADVGDYNMIVLGSHGRSLLKGFLLGAVHAKILHHANQPVMLVRDARPINRILVAYRGSRCDQRALEFIAPLFQKKKPEITILHVQETEWGESKEFAESCVLTGERTLAEFGYKPVKKTAKGDFVDEILKSVAIERYDLLVLGAYGHNRPKYLSLLSDEALNLVRLSTRPVLVYRDRTEI
jgi:nucleotide-binding universal stress UspA family protein